MVNVDQLEELINKKGLDRQDLVMLVDSGLNITYIKNRIVMNVEDVLAIIAEVKRLREAVDLLSSAPRLEHRLCDCDRRPTLFNDNNGFWVFCCSCSKGTKSLPSEKEAWNSWDRKEIE